MEWRHSRHVRLEVTSRKQARCCVRLLASHYCYETSFTPSINHPHLLFTELMQAKPMVVVKTSFQARFLEQQAFHPFFL